MLAFVGEAVRLGALPLFLVSLGFAVLRLERVVRGPYRAWRCHRTTERIRRRWPTAPVAPPARRREEPGPRIQVRPRRPEPAPARVANLP
ncbi:hypothetical protein [Streptoalloteichus hindustanus]|uniref:Uncharacterized protein n=1 Tax=Streptoalloteichus hindustanus TaxID=2017 RepID=A0A1M4UV03_STRHI|nr:hypothetical protein [Streptoalloteichus hindustanus]SHE60453.1 hypothetical protein SAMN05444320_101550 [Streptoalloteichus hindustanus]